MPRFVCCYEDKFFEFSTVVDAPVTGLMSEKEFVEHYTQMYGEMAAESDHRDGMRARMDRARKNGLSAMTGEQDAGLEEFLKSSMFQEFGTYDEETEDYTIDKWPGMEAFARDYLGGDSTDEVVGLQEHVKPVD